MKSTALAALALFVSAPAVLAAPKICPDICIIPEGSTTPVITSVAELSGSALAGKACLVERRDTRKGRRYGRNTAPLSRSSEHSIQTDEHR
ncbi:hypothetical protein PsYK624_091920 [Phanerochaete sordida]|uniref:Uncharacterized protein n=1 Tax=Phanerochaete sordida TaxID=48140 RepID=A0A9P3GBI2_9APHY|nr:hypothetical protein PsYK624_091920 [Phanerochaete sordida]